MSKTSTPHRDGVATPFVAAHQSVVTGVLHGWDRLRLQGTLRTFYQPTAMDDYLARSRVKYAEFKDFTTRLTGRVRAAGVKLAKESGAPYIYMPGTSASKEEAARAACGKAGITSGLAAVLACVEPCRTWFMRRCRETKKVLFQLRQGKCLHLYYYFLHEVLGWMHLRLQTWFPYLIHVCLNGREWLARRMDAARLAYQREDNCFTELADGARAQELMDEQHGADWPGLLRPLVAQCHPLHPEIVAPFGASCDYYWGAAQSEYAADVMFRDRASLTRIYPALVHHSMMHLGSEEVLRFMGRKQGPRPGEDVCTDCRRGGDGVRVKHWWRRNSQKMYDKGSVLRCETTINEPHEFKVCRAAENDPGGEKSWRILRKGLADMARRAELCRAICRRHYTALAAVAVKAPLSETVAPVSRRIRRKGRSHRALQPLGKEDAALLAAVQRGEHLAAGLRNRDVRPLLYGETKNPQRRRRDMARTGRRLLLLRAHGLLAKVHGAHRYHLTPKGQQTITALQAARRASTEKLLELAA
jgi:hypothetical protein